ncbi:MAG: hypothetical protein K2L05_06035 [Muribaculaceae bacterium]|nr:hypothetical protein [Muribaculaceae bacterium]
MKNLCITLLICLMAFPPALRAESSVKPYLQVDAVSAYLWRGQKCGGVSLQPVAGVNIKNFSAFFWGNIQLCPTADSPDKHEIDLFLKYKVKNFTIGLKDVYVNSRGAGVFSFGSIPHAANCLDIICAYDFKYVEAEWTTTVAGYDGYNHSGRRAYGSYLMLTSPFKARWFDFSAQLGIVPYYCSRYSEDNARGFHVNMCAVKMSHTFIVQRAKMQITPYSQLMVNPSALTAHLSVGARISFNP